MLQSQVKGLLLQLLQLLLQPPALLQTALPNRLALVTLVAELARGFVDLHLKRQLGVH